MTGWNGKIHDMVRKVQDLEISVHAAHACYFLILSAFPTLVLLLGLLRHTDLGAADLMDLVAGYLPAPLLPHAWELISETYGHTSKTVLSVSVLTALWSAGKGIYGLMKGLNRIYSVQERRSWLRTRVMCAVYMVLFILVLLLTLVLHVFGNTIVEFLRVRGSGIFRFWADLVDFRFFLLVGIQCLLFCVMYMYLPGRDNGFRASLPGALFSSFGWMAISSVFSLYVARSSGYSSIFGPVYAVALVMLWLYVCVYTVFLGAVLNRILSDLKN